MDWRAKYRNPSPPPGYVEGPRPRLVLKKDLIENDGEVFKFLALVIESGILDDSDPPSDFSIQTSDDEVKLIPVAPKVPPVIDLDVECVELSDGEIPSTPETPPVPKAESSAKKPSVKVKESSSSLRQLKEILPQPVKVKKHTKKEKVVEYSSDSSSSESYKKKKKRSHAHEKTRRKHRSRSPSSPERDVDVDRKEHKFNPTQVKQEDNLFGQYFCEVCKLNMNAEGSYLSHLNGKRHLKALKSQKQNIAQSVENSLISNVIKPTRYPTAPPDIVRIRVKEVALLQRVVEERAPCPALDKVIEIQGIDETHYYCELCDAPCSSNSIIPHLKGRKHQLMCLSFFDELRYESIKNKTNRRELDSLLNKYLKNIIQSKRGPGYMTVEKEIERNDLRDPYSSHGGKVVRREDIPGPSHRHDYPEDRLPETFQETLIPDTSKADFYCPTCDSHMNNISMWEAHIRGKRHLKNVKKAPGEGPSKARSYPLPGERAMIMDELDQVTEPVVGLQFIRETQNPEVGGALYNCFPCGACLTSIDIIDHILSQKHRTKFLEKINNRDWQTLSLMSIQERHVGSLIEEACMREEEKNGRGMMEVHIIRSAAVSRW